MRGRAAAERPRAVVRLDNGHDTPACTAGKMRKHR